MNNKAEKEKFARENYFMKKKNEEIFILVVDSSAIKKKKEDNSLFECKCGHMLFRQPEEFVSKYMCTKCSKIYIGEGNGKYKAKAKTREKKRA